MSREQLFQKNNRIRKKKDFNGFSRDARKLSFKHLLVFIQKRQDTSCRLGITVSRFAGNAVQRNRFKRLSREFFRKNKELFLGFDLLFIARNHKAEMKNSKKYESELVNDYSLLLKKIDG